MFYAVKINKTGQYITYCDKCWYEVYNEPLYLFTYEEAKAITEQMRKHYQYHFTIEGRYGTTEIVNLLSKGNPMKEEKTEKKKLFSFKTSNVKLNK